MAGHQGLSRVTPLLNIDPEATGVDLEQPLITHIQGHPSISPWPTNDFVVSCDGRMSLQDRAAMPAAAKVKVPRVVL